MGKRETSLDVELLELDSELEEMLFGGEKEKVSNLGIGRENNLKYREN